MTQQQASEYILWICIFSSLAMIGNCIFSIITGPQIAHYLNICAFLLTFNAVWLLIKNKLFKNTRSLLLIIINLSIGLFAMYIKYGYFDWHYSSIISIARPN